MQGGDERGGSVSRSETDDAGTERSLTLMLQAAREAQGLSIEDVSAELRIEPRNLRAIEEGRFDAVGPPVFAKGYLKQYGQRLGLDYRDLLSEYYRLVGPSDVEITGSKVIKLRDERQITVWIVAVITLGVLAALLLYWWVRQPPVAAPADATDGAAQVEGAPSAGGARASTPQPAQAPPFAPDPDAGPASAPGAVDAGAGGRAAEVPPSASGEASAEAAATPPPAAAPVSAQVAAGPDEAAGDASGRPSRAGSTDGRPARAAAPDDAGPAASSAQSAAEDAAALRLELEFGEDCWAEITDAAGRRVFYGLGREGTRASLRGVAPLRLFLGNADGVALTVEGRRYTIPAGSRRGNLANFTIDASAAGRSAD